MQSRKVAGIQQPQHIICRWTAVIMQSLSSRPLQLEEMTAKHGRVALCAKTETQSVSQPPNYSQSQSTIPPIITYSA